MSNIAVRDNQHNINTRGPAGFLQKSREAIPQNLPFGYRIDPRTIATLATAGSSHLLHGVRPQLWIDTPKATSRVEIQIPIKLALHPFPQSIKKVHLQPYTIAKAKFLAKPVHQPSPDTLELHAALVCASAISDPARYKFAMARAAETNLARKRPAIRQPSKGKQAEIKPGEDVRQGAEVWICDGCMNRERKRNERKKSKKAEEEEAWKEYETQRIIVFNSLEIRDWEMFSSPDPSDEQRQYPVSADPPQGSMQVNLPMRIACYCRHHDEKHGFRVIFTLKTHLGEVVTQNITLPINITDDHKTASKEGINASSWNNPVQPSDLNQDGNQQNGAPFRNAHSTTDLQGLQQSFSKPQVHGFPSPFANPQNFTQQTQPSPISRGVSRQGSPSINTPAAKKRKSSMNPSRLPESLKMTRLQSAGSQANDAGTSYPTSPVYALSPVQTINPDQQLMNAQVPMSYTGPDTNGFGFMHRSSRSQSYENLANLQTMYSAPASTFPSRAPSPGPAGPYATAFNSQQVQSQMLAHVLTQTGSISQMPTIQQSSPIIHKVIPRHGPKAGGVEVTVVGSGFFNGLNVQFGDALATTTTYWADSTLVCLLPPARSAGKVPVMLQSSIDPLRAANYSTHQGKLTKFEYVDDDEVELMRRALVLVGRKDTGRQEDAADVARRIIDQNRPGSSGRGGATNGSYRQANGTRETSTEKLDCEPAVLKCLDLIDTSESPFPACYDLKGRNGQTALHLASSLGYYRLVSALLARGANPDARDKNGMSPMHMAALNDHLAIVRKLKYAGGDLTMRSLAGWIPADMASSHATHFALRSASSFRSSSIETRPSSSLSASSSMAMHPRNLRRMSRDYYDQSDEEFVISEDTFDDEEDLLEPTNHAKVVQQWAASRRNSGEDDLTPLIPSQLDLTGHRYVQFVAAWRDQFAAQWQQFQQSLGLPPIALADYQNQTNLMTRGFGALRGSWPTSADSKERLQTESQRWWDFLTGNNSPPSYDEIYPASSSKDSDLKTESAARASLEAEADMKCNKMYDSSVVQNSAREPSSSADVFSDNETDLLQQQRGKSPKRLRSDRKLFIFWIPLLVLVVTAMLRDRIPEIRAVTRYLVECTSSGVENTHTTTPLAMAEETPNIILVA